MGDDRGEAARRMENREKREIGATISELARRGVVRDAGPVVEVHDGIPVWVHGPSAMPVTSEMVGTLAEDW